MDTQVKIQKTSMQELIDILYQTMEFLKKDGNFKGHDYSLSVEAISNLLNNSFEIEASVISEAFNYGFLQAELKERADVTDGYQYVKKYFKKNENISSKV